MENAISLESKLVSSLDMFAPTEQVPAKKAAGKQQKSSFLETSRNGKVCSLLLELKVPYQYICRVCKNNQVASSGS